MNQQAPPSPDPQAADTPSGPPPRTALEMKSLSDELLDLQQQADGKGMAMGEILDRLKDRGHMMFIIVIIGPFLFLPTTFGLSAPIGLAIAIIGLCITIGIKPWLPGFILRKEFPGEGLDKILGRAARMSTKVERLAKPRLGIMLWPGLLNLTGLELTLWALLMALPGPNFLFAFMITLIAFGLLMRDGVLLLLAHILTLISPVLVWIYWAPIKHFSVESWEKMLDLVKTIWGKLEGVLAVIQ
jgi:hypothetical protein